MPVGVVQQDAWWWHARGGLGNVWFNDLYIGGSAVM